MLKNTVALFLSITSRPAWNHFTKNQIAELFSDCFKIERLLHYRSLEGDGYTRFFYTALMQKKP
jgi:hypothetical protein